MKEFKITISLGTNANLTPEEIASAFDEFCREYPYTQSWGVQVEEEKE